ncbi:heme-binding domain-containing protein [Aurantibacter crassamenti]|uniref:heme-binding domain-containing protein n=1 Tax=Aurantibacter crassamenti TaxID=1837375 RepID=UPI0019399DE9|nr:heme-binding domain-containing protein [Aurantibacter crassamenti]MBM1107568.1 heme-binding domain-containing protein [Aurantibacter crassamenti]
MKLLKKLFLGLLLVLVIMQFFRPEKNSAQGDHLKVFIEETNPSVDIKLILEQSCYDCHSNNTQYPWYNDVAPISFWLAHHIKDGKKDLNFSEWDSYDAKKKDHKLEEVVEMVTDGEMPLNEYTWTHSSARLTEKQRNDLVVWAKTTRLLYQAKLLQE